MSDPFAKLAEFAVAKEEEAAAFYGFLASLTRQEHIRKVFEEFAQEEKAHKKVFEKILKEGCRVGPGKTPVAVDLHISDYLVEIPFNSDMSYQDALILGMKREEKSSALYKDMAQKISDPCLADTVRKLVKEEEKHKAHLESLYESEILTDD
jgi:rubrerythrin